MTAGLALFACLFSGNAMAEVRLLAFGDSLTAGYGLPANQSFPAQLERALRQRGHDVRVINGGYSGDTTAAGLARLDWSLADNPHGVILELGANDALRGVNPSQTFANLDAILARLTDRSLPVLFAGMRAPPNLGSEYAKAFSGVFGRLAERYDVVYYEFFLDGVAAMPEFNQPDGIHPTAEGTQRIVERILPRVEQLIARIKKGGQEQAKDGAAAPGGGRPAGLR
jgi:acyl-CoA thioesterase-1